MHSGNSRNSLCRKKKTGPANRDLPSGHDKWEKHSGAIPKAIRDKITEVIATNLRSPNPMPLVLKVGENVDGTHDLKVRIFAHNGHMHIGLHMLCPNSLLK